MGKIIKLEPGVDPTAQINPLPQGNYWRMLLIVVGVLVCLLAAFVAFSPTMAAVRGEKTATPTPTATLSPTASQTGTATAAAIAVPDNGGRVITTTPGPTATPAIYVTVIHDTQVEKVEVTRQIPFEVIKVQTQIVAQQVPVTVIVEVPITVVVTATPSATGSPTPTATASPTPTATPTATEQTEEPTP